MQAAARFFAASRCHDDAESDSTEQANEESDHSVIPFISQDAHAGTCVVIYLILSKQGRLNEKAGSWPAS
jgi:hypothetical protein